MKKDKCELCGFTIKTKKHYSLDECNKTGKGVTLHKECAKVLQSLEDAVGHSVVAKALEENSVVRPSSDVVRQTTITLNRDHSWGLTRLSLDAVELTEPAERKDPKLIDKFREMYLKAPEKVPPPVVYYHPRKCKYFLTDGHHRFLGAQKAGLSKIWFVDILE